MKKVAQKKVAQASRRSSTVEQASRRLPKVEQASRLLSPAGHPILPRNKFKDFTDILDRVAEHPNRRYFIFKSITRNSRPPRPASPAVSLAPRSGTEGPNQPRWPKRSM